jgi:hypothetical protein
MPLILSGNTGTSTLDSSNGLTFSDASLQGAAASPDVLKNRIINGAMVIDQRNAGASVTPTVSGTYTLDRWRAGLSVASKFSVQQNAAAVTPPVGFVNYLGCTSLSDYSVGASELFNIGQRIEGYNIADLNWGTANAKTVTLLFWVRSSLTGTFGGSLRNSAQDRSYPFSYTISVANTWELKSVTIAGDTSGTWLTNNSIGIGVRFSIGTGSTFSGTAGAWSGSTFYSSTGATSVVGTNGATWYVTGVQLEQNTSATPFERRLYGQELINCQRYFEKSYNVSVAPGTAGSGLGAISAVAYTAASNRPFLGIQFQVAKRADTTITLYSPNSGVAGKIEGPSSADFTASVQYAGTQAFQVYQSQTTSTSNGDYYIQWTASAEL